MFQYFFLYASSVSLAYFVNYLSSNFRKYLEIYFYPLVATDISPYSYLYRQPYLNLVYPSYTTNKPFLANRFHPCNLCLVSNLFYANSLIFSYKQYSFLTQQLTFTRYDHVHDFFNFGTSFLPFDRF